MYLVAIDHVFWVSTGQALPTLFRSSIIQLDLDDPLAEPYGHYIGTASSAPPILPPDDSVEWHHLFHGSSLLWSTVLEGMHLRDSSFHVADWRCR